jgi:hypothetical protein
LRPRAVADTVAELHADLEAGGGISGPAAKRAIKAAAAAPRFAGTIITATTARRLLAVAAPTGRLTWSLGTAAPQLIVQVL